MKLKLLFELKRKFIHLLSLLFILIYWAFLKKYSHEIGLLALSFILLFFLVLDYFRIKKKMKIPIFHFLWRVKEKNKFGGNVFFIIGAIISFAVFDFWIALAALLMTTFGDMAAALIGMSFGKHRLKRQKNRTLEGIIAEFVVDLIIAYVLIDTLVIVFSMALVATFVETKLEYIDDNLSIPVFAGFVGQILKILI